MILMSGKPEQHTFHKLVTVNSFLSVVSKRELDLPLLCLWSSAAAPSEMTTCGGALE